ncbi:Cadmium-induced protein CadI [compost metagenome]
MAKPHVSLNVTNVAQSVEFYRKFFGVDPIKLKADYAKFDLSEPALNFTMNQRQPAQDGEHGRLSHLGIQVESHEGVAAARKRLEDAGMISLDEEDTVCCYARQDKVWAIDPDGNQWEVFYVMEADVEAESFVSDATEPSACCAPADEQNATACCAPETKAEPVTQAKSCCG